MLLVGMELGVHMIYYTSQELSLKSSYYSRTIMRGIQERSPLAQDAWGIMPKLGNSIRSWTCKKGDCYVVRGEKRSVGLPKGPNVCMNTVVEAYIGGRL